MENATQPSIAKRKRLSKPVQRLGFTDNQIDLTDEIDTSHSDDDYAETARQPHDSRANKRFKPRKLDALDLAGFVGEVQRLSVLATEEHEKYLKLYHARGEKTNEINSLVEDRNTYRTLYKNSQSELAQLKENFERYRDNSTRRAKEQKRSHAEAETNLLLQIKSKQRLSVPDDVLNSALRELFQDCRSWSQRYLADGFLDHPASVCLSTMRKCLPSLRNGQQLWMKYKIQDLGHRVRLFGFAFLGRLVMNRYLTHASWFLDDKQADAFDEACDDLAKVDVRGAYLWRADAVRLYRASMNIPDCELQLMRVHSKQLDKISSDHATQIIAVLGRSSLVRGAGIGHSEAESDLEAILKKAGLVSLEIFSRSSSPAVLGSSEFLAKPFSITSTHHAPDRCIDIENNDRRLDGRLIEAVLLPALVLRDKVNDNSPEAERVIYKAQVLVDDTISSPQDFGAIFPPSSNVKTPQVQNRTIDLAENVKWRETEPPSTQSVPQMYKTHLVRSREIYTKDIQATPEAQSMLEKVASGLDASHGPARGLKQSMSMSIHVPSPSLVVKETDQENTGMTTLGEPRGAGLKLNQLTACVDTSGSTDWQQDEEEVVPRASIADDSRKPSQDPIRDFKKVLPPPCEESQTKEQEVSRGTNLSDHSEVAHGVSNSMVNQSSSYTSAMERNQETKSTYSDVFNAHI